MWLPTMLAGIVPHPHPYLGLFWNSALKPTDIEINQL
jgi:hypothetical protein